MSELTTASKILPALNAVQLALAEQGIAKNKFNQQQQFAFRGIDDVYDALAPLLAKNKIIIIPNVIERTCDTRQTKQGAAQYFVLLKVEYKMISTEDGSSISINVFGEAADMADKATNKSMAAAYKYAMFQAFCIPIDAVDPDGSSPPETVDPNRKTQPSSQQPNHQQSSNQSRSNQSKPNQSNQQQQYGNQGRPNGNRQQSNQSTQSKPATQQSKPQENAGKPPVSKPKEVGSVNVPIKDPVPTGKKWDSEEIAGFLNDLESDKFDDHGLHSALATLYRDQAVIGQHVGEMVKAVLSKRADKLPDSGLVPNFDKSIDAFVPVGIISAAEATARKNALRSRFNLDLLPVPK